MWIVGVVLLVIVAVILIFVSNKLTNIVVSPSKMSINDALDREVEAKYITSGYYEDLEKEDFWIISDDGHKLVGQTIKNKVPTDQYVILCHGYGYNRVGGIKYFNIFLKEGFNIVIYDHRNSGESQGSYTTMGYKEKKDLKKVVDYVYGRFGSEITVGTHGESMGAATVLLHAAEDRRVAFVIADCPYSDLKDQLAFRLKLEHKLPRFPFLALSSLFSKIRSGFFFGQVSPIEVIKKYKGLPELPIFFIHGDADTYIPPSMTLDMYQVKKGYKKLYLAKGADHAISVCVDRDRYASEIHDFLNSETLK